VLDVAGIVPNEFRGAVVAGELVALLGAADWQDERDNPNAGLLLRAAYYRITGQANVVVPAGNGTVAVLNPQVVTKRSPVVPGIGVCRAAVVEVGKSVRIVSVRTAHTATPPSGPLPGRAATEVNTFVAERIFRLGDPAEYDAFNLVYYAPITSITTKTVVIVDLGGTEMHRLSLAKFVEKNHDFDLARARKRNDEWMD
jgi:hypothetical protein